MQRYYILSASNTDTLEHMVNSDIANAKATPVGGISVALFQRDEFNFYQAMRREVETDEERRMASVKKTAGRPEWNPLPKCPFCKEKGRVNQTNAQDGKYGYECEVCTTRFNPLK